MKTFLFSDNDVWHREIKANTHLGALRKAKSEFGIAVPMRCIRFNGESKDYKANDAFSSYECSIREV